MDNNKTKPYASRAYKRSRAAYKMECTFEYFISILVGDAFLANLLTRIGFSEASVGIISSLVTLAFLFQLVSVFMVRKITNTKLTAILFHSFGQLFFVSLYLVPFMPFAVEIRKPLAVICILMAYFGNYMVSNLIFRWGNSYVDPSKRASYTAGKEIISLLTGMMVSFGAGFLIDRFEKEGNTEGGFIFAAIAILIFCISDLCMLLLIKNDVKPKAERGNETSLKDILINTLGNRNFMSVVVLAIMWDSSRYLVIGFMGTYKNSLYALGTVQIINVVSQLARAVFSKPFGIYTSKRTFAKGIELGLVVAASAMLANVFTTPATAFMVIVYSLLYSICCAGIMGNIANITYSYVDSRYFVEASAIKNSIAGLFGFGASLIGGKILSAVQNNGNMIFGISVHGQQVLSAISFLMLILTILFTHFIVSKQKVMMQ